MNTLPILLLLLAGEAGPAPPPVIRANAPSVSIQEGDTLHKDGWTVSPEVDPDIYEAALPEGRPLKVSFITDVESISFTVEEGRSYDFVIRYQGRDCRTRIVGSRLTPAARFDEAYRASHRGQILVEAPEVYELVNVALALTATGIANRDLVYHDSDYYRRVRAFFDPYRDDPLVAALDAELSAAPQRYFSLKMNGYAFEFDREGRIVQSRTYDRTAFPGERTNTLRPHLARLQAFAERSGFRRFYRDNAATYAEQAAFFREQADVGEMKRWLDRNFPSASRYDCYKVVFSPLVAYNQSATWLESDGFRELQAHVNYPYPQDLARPGLAPLSERAAVLLRGDIVFTELNHGYINPEADKYADRVRQAVRDWAYWVDEAKGPDYYRDLSTFNEYMNWALVSLRFVDDAPAEELAELVGRVDRMMVERRGFRRFKEFDAFLIDLYRTRGPGQTVADLYPRIIEWFERTGPH